MRNLLPFRDCLSITRGKFFFNVERVRVPTKSVRRELSFTKLLTKIDH